MKYLLIIVVVVFIIFGNGIGGDFVYDDHLVVELNARLHESGVFFKQLVLPYHYQQPESGLYRPLTMMSFIVNFWLGDGPIGFHIVNILIHAANVFLLYVILERLFHRRTISLIAAGLFLVLPIHVEAISAISGRPDLLATLFALISVYACIKQKYAWSAIALLFALFSKESAVGIVFALAYLIFVFQKKTFREAVRSCIWYVGAGLIYACLRYVALKEYFLGIDVSFVYNPLKFVDPFTRVLSAIKIGGMYLWKSVVPIHLSADYSYNQIPLASWKDAMPVALAFLVFASLLGIIFWRRTRNSIYAFGSVFLLGTFLVVSNFIVPIGTIMAERTFYLPSVGLIVILAALVAYAMESKWRKSMLAFMVIIGIAYGARTMARNTVWHDRETLFTDMAATASQSVHTNNNLGIYYMDTDQWDLARIVLERALKITPDHPSLMNSLGILAEHDMRYAEAEKYYLRALELRPHYVKAVSSLARMYYDAGAYTKVANIALLEYQNKNDDDLYAVYALSMIRLKKYQDVIRGILAEYGEDPKNSKIIYALGAAYWKSGDKDTARRYLSQVENPNLSDIEFYENIERL